MGEVRYNSLARANKEKAAVLFANAEKHAKAKYEHLVDLANL